ncbi:MAG: hypothetical protein ACYC0V_07540 [Armatimonadota bacterium]
METKINPDQILRMSSEIATALHNSDLPEDLISTLLGDHEQMKLLRSEQIRLISAFAHGEFHQKDTACNSITNPFSKEIIPTFRNYPSGFEMASWQKQAKTLLSIGAFSDLSTDGLEEMAERFLSMKQEFWDKSFTFSFSNRSMPLWDGLIVFVLPGKWWAKYEKRKKKLYDDIALGVDGDGYWGFLCEEVLFTELPKIVQFINCRKGGMRSSRYLPVNDVAIWLQGLESRVPGDFACLPFNLGRRTAGFSVRASRWIAENEINAIVTPTWINGQILITHPNMIDLDHIMFNNAGDQYRYGADHKFLSAPFFGGNDLDRIEFSTDRINSVYGCYGAVLSTR